MSRIQNSSDSGSPLRVLYDGMIYHRQRAGGINRYFEKIIDHLPGNIAPEITLTSVPMTNFPKSNRLNQHIKSFHLPRPFRKVSRAIRSVRFEALRMDLAPDLVHATYYDTLAGYENIESGPPFVVTVHDMTHEKFPELLDRRGRHAALKQRAIRRADSIICVSKRTRDDLLERYPECANKVQVIYHATSLGTIEPDDWSPENQRPYVLFVGSRAGYKNFNGLLQAFKNVVARIPEVQLRAVGSHFSDHEQRNIESLGLTNHVIAHDLVSDRRLASMYRKSKLLVYPSLYEGFGLPLIEAMSCGTPVLAANTSCIPEVVQNAAMLFDPQKPDDFIEAICYLLKNSCVCKQLIKDGYKQCQQFSWTEAANRTVNVYQTALAASKIRVGNRLSMAHVIDGIHSARLTGNVTPNVVQRTLSAIALTR